MSIEECKKLIIELMTKIDDPIILNRIRISLMIASTKKEESD